MSNDTIQVGDTVKLTEVVLPSASGNVSSPFYATRQGTIGAVREVYRHSWGNAYRIEFLDGVSIYIHGSAVEKVDA